MERKAKYSKWLKLEIIKRYMNGESATSLSNESFLKSSLSKKIHTWSILSLAFNLLSTSFSANPTSPNVLYDLSLESTTICKSLDYRAYFLAILFFKFSTYFFSVFVPSE